MLSHMKQLIKDLLLIYPQSIVRAEFAEQSFLRFNERPVEYAFVLKALSEFYPKSILDVGTGQSALPHLLRTCGFLVTAIDNIEDYWPSGMRNRHYHVLNDDITNPMISTTFDAVTCISVLEHINNHAAAVKNMFRLLKKDGYLLLTCPYSEKKYIENVYALPGSSYGQNVPYVCQSYSRDKLSSWLSENNGELLKQEFWQFWDGEYWTVGNQIIPPRKSTAAESHQISCMLIRKLS